MIIEQATNRRELRTETLNSDLVIVGGGLAGTCCAIAAAREGGIINEILEENLSRNRQANAQPSKQIGPPDPLRFFTLRLSTNSQL